MARVICLMFLTLADPSPDILAGSDCHVSALTLALATPEGRLEAGAEGVGGFVEGRGQLVGEGLLVGQLGQDVRPLRLEEAVELALELADPRRRDVVELAGRGDVQDRDLLLDAERLVLRLLDDLRELLAAGQLVPGGLVQVRRELRERREGTGTGPGPA